MIKLLICMLTLLVLAGCHSVTCRESVKHDIVGDGWVKRTTTKVSVEYFRHPDGWDKEAGSD